MNARKLFSPFLGRAKGSSINYVTRNIFLTGREGKASA